MTSKTLRHSALALIVAGTAATAAHAEGLYLGGSLGAPDWHSSVNGIDGSEHGVAGKLYGGYAFTPNYALEAGVSSFGKTRSSFGEAKAHDAFVDLVGTLPLNNDWSLLGRVGVAHAKFKTSFGDDSGTGAKIGIGTEYALNKTSALRLEYEYNHFRNVFDSSANVGMLTAGVKVAF